MNTYTDAQIESMVQRCVMEPGTLVSKNITLADMLRSLLAERKAAIQPQGGAGAELSAWVGDMKTSAGMDYYVCVGTAQEFGKYMTPNVYKIRARAEYDVACWNHMLGRCEKPHLLDFDTDEQPPQHVQPQDGEAWVPASINPDVAAGNDGYFWIAVRRSGQDKVFTFPAVYANSLPLCSSADDPKDCSGPGWSQTVLSEDDDGDIAITGWYGVTSDSEYDERYTPVCSKGDEIIAWQEGPKFEATQPPQHVHVEVETCEGCGSDNLILKCCDCDNETYPNR